jgi:tetratricopeptide (TPR) repeat protein
MRLPIWAILCAGLCAGAIDARADSGDYLDACARKGEQGKLEESVGLCTRAINAGDLSPDNLVTAYTNRAISYRGLRQFDKALADCSKALSLSADDAEAHSACANAYGGKGEYAKGIDHFDHVLAARPDDAEAPARRLSSSMLAPWLNSLGERTPSDQS